MWAAMITSVISLPAFREEETLLKQSSSSSYLFISPSLSQRLWAFSSSSPSHFKGQDYIVINNVSIVHVSCFYYSSPSTPFAHSRNVQKCCTQLVLVSPRPDVFVTINRYHRPSVPQGTTKPCRVKTSGNNACFGKLQPRNVYPLDKRNTGWS